MERLLCMPCFNPTAPSPPLLPYTIGCWSDLPSSQLGRDASPDRSSLTPEGSSVDGATPTAGPDRNRARAATGEWAVGQSRPGWAELP